MLAQVMNKLDTAKIDNEGHKASIPVISFESAFLTSIIDRTA